MKKFSPLVILRQFGMKAAIPTAIILAGHWFRYRALDWKDLLFAALVFTAYLILASWLESRKIPKI